MRTERTPHQRRQTALQFAGAITAVLFVGWIATMGLRVSTHTDQTAQDKDQAQLVASVESGVSAMQTGIKSIYYQPPASTY